MMSYSNGLTPQFGGIVSGIATALSGIKNGAFARYLTNGQKTRWKGTNTATLSEKIDEVKSEKELISHEDNRVLEDLGLGHLPKDWAVQIDSLVNIKPQPKTNAWFVSHISSDSFYRNKHGFSATEPRHTNPYITALSRFLQLKQPINVNMKRFVHYGTNTRIQTLEDRANAEDDNPIAQAEYLREMLKHDPEYVVRRYESGHYANGDSVKKEYLKALVLTERVNSEDIDKISTANQFGFKKGFNFNSKKGEDGKNVTGIGSKDSPVYVAVQKEHGSVFLEQLFTLIRFLIGIILVLSVVESQLKMKMSNQKEVVPDSGDKKFKFHDVQGVEEAKAELQEVVEFLRNPSKFKKLGGKLPTGVLLIGAPGTGKTLLAKAVAGEAGVPFFFCSGAEFDEMFVGVGAARVRNLFAAARDHAPCIIFIDELDAIGGTRVINNQQPYSRMTLNQLLVELDGFEKSDGIVVIGATNFPETLDKALVRPGRFDTKIDVPVPDVKGRYDILKVHLKNVLVSDEVDLKVLARGTPGFTGADLANLVNQAAIKAASDGDSAVTTSHLEFAKDKIIMGPERKSMVIADMNKKLVAYHEGGHAIVAYYTPGSIPLHKATIIPRGQALGMVSQLPEGDDLQWTRKQLLAKLDVCMAGRVAEEIIFGKENVTTGASSDSEQATKIAKAMVTRYCMSDKIGMLQVTDRDKLSPETQSVIEGEVKKLLMDSYERARNIIHTHAKEHLRLAEALLKYETLDAKEIELVLQGKPLERTL